MSTRASLIWIGSAIAAIAILILGNVSGLLLTWWSGALVIALLLGLVLIGIGIFSRGDDA